MTVEHGDEVHRITAGGGQTDTIADTVGDDGLSGGVGEEGEGGGRQARSEARHGCDESGGYA